MLQDPCLCSNAETPELGEVGQNRVCGCCPMKWGKLLRSTHCVRCTTIFGLVFKKLYYCLSDKRDSCLSSRQYRQGPSIQEVSETESHVETLKGLLLSKVDVSNSIHTAILSLACQLLRCYCLPMPTNRLRPFCPALVGVGCNGTRRDAKKGSRSLGIRGGM